MNWIYFIILKAAKALAKKNLSYNTQINISLDITEIERKRQKILDRNMRNVKIRRYSF